jgi:hypothetical protein
VTQKGLSLLRQRSQRQPTDDLDRPRITICRESRPDPSVACQSCCFGWDACVPFAAFAVALGVARSAMKEVSRRAGIDVPESTIKRPSSVAIAPNEGRFGPERVADRRTTEVRQNVDR